MAKLYFYYSSMNAGKSTILLQSDHNYRERGMQTLLLTPSIDDRYAQNTVTSRIGLTAGALGFSANDDLYAIANNQHQPIHCVLVDEAQFLTELQVWQLSEIVDKLDIPVLTYGLRSDFLGYPFAGSSYLLTMADNLIEIKTVCHCGKKATHTLRVGADNQVVTDGEQVEIGGNDRYISVCRKHFKAKAPSTAQVRG